MKYFRFIFIFSLFPFLIGTFAHARNLSGSLSGVLGPGNYYVVGDIHVMYGNSLTLQPGTTFLFNGDYDFLIYGAFYAVGTEADSIKFLRNGFASQWNGIDFNVTASDSSRLEYCLISGSDGGGVFCYGCDPTIAHCTISGNSAGVG